MGLSKEKALENLSSCGMLGAASPRMPRGAKAAAMGEAVDDKGFRLMSCRVAGGWWATLWDRPFRGEGNLSAWPDVSDDAGSGVVESSKCSDANEAVLVSNVRATKGCVVNSAAKPGVGS